MFLILIKLHGKVDSKFIWYAHGIITNCALLLRPSLKPTQLITMPCSSRSSYKWHPFPPPWPPSFYHLWRHCLLTVHSTWIGLKTCQIKIHRSRFEACLPKYVENPMIVFRDTMLTEQVELIKVSKESNISSSLVFLVSTLLLDLVADGWLFESGSFPLQTWQKFLTTHSSDWKNSPPSQ